MNDQSDLSKEVATRTLAAVMFTDIVGYTTISQSDEEQALQVLERHNRLLRPFFSKHGGREVKTIGDSFLIEFSSALEATKCAIEIQEFLHDYNFSSNKDWKINLRIGIHLGDVVHQNSDIFGDAVNIASRIQPLAEPGGICVTQQVCDQIHNKIGNPMKLMTNIELKNVKFPINVYAIVMSWQKVDSKSIEDPVVGREFDSHRIAVLPFVNVSADPNDEYFADGMTDEMISVLSKITGMRVVARTSAMRFKGVRDTVRHIAQELRVGSLVEGTVRKSKNRVRISIQLIDSQNEDLLWSETYDQDLGDIFSMQREIALHVAHSLELKFSEETTEIAHQTDSTEAHSFYLKGRLRWNRRSEFDLISAIKYFEEAVSHDPLYALAYVGLADCYSILGYYGYRRPSIVYPRARELVEKALTLDKSLAEAHASFGLTLMNYYFEWAKAAEELDQALELNPSYATAHFWRATLHASQGKFENCIEEIRKAADLDPLSVIIQTDYARNLFLAGRPKEAMDQYEKALKLDPSFAIAHKGLAEVYVSKGLYQDAIVAIEKAITLSEGSVFIFDDLGYIYARSGDRAKALEVLSTLEEQSSERYIPSWGRAVIYAGLEDGDKTIEWLGRAYEERWSMTYTKVDPAFHFLRNDDRFKALLKKMGL